MPGVTCASSALMWLGYITYPNTFLLPANKDILNESPFFYEPTNQIKLLQPVLASNAVSFNISLETGWPYHVLRSEDLKSWSNYTAFVSASSTQQITISRPNSRSFFRVKYP